MFSIGVKLASAIYTRISNLGNIGIDLLIGICLLVHLFIILILTLPNSTAGKQYLKYSPYPPFVQVHAGMAYLILAYIRNMQDVYISAL